jgi:ABC-type nitrate/sulfonate/bicarbonate transport system substrate-binding protein
MKPNAGYFLIGLLLMAAGAAILTNKIDTQRGSHLAQQLLLQQSQRHITALRDVKKQQVEDHFRLVLGQLRQFAEDPMTVGMMRGLRPAYAQFAQEAATPESLPLYHSAVQNYYNTEFSQEYQALNGEAAPVNDLLAGLSDNAAALQYHYIAANPNPLGTKEELNAASDASAYTHLHRQYHGNLRQFISRFGYNDILLVDADTGNVLYSVLKQVDFGASLSDGAAAKSGLGQVFSHARQASAGEARLIDFSSYLPAYQEPMAFAAAPVFDGDNRIGVAVFALSIDRVNDILTEYQTWPLDTFWRTGEVMIVAADGTLRNDSRWLAEDKTQYLQDIAATGLDQAVIDKIARKNTTVNLQKADNPGVRSALAGVTGFDLFEDQRGKFVQSAIAPINVPGLSWAILSNAQENESLQAVQSLKDGMSIRAWLHPGEERKTAKAADGERPKFSFAVAKSPATAPWLLAADSGILQQAQEEFGVSVAFNSSLSYAEVLSQFQEGKLDAAVISNVDAFIRLAAKGSKADVILITAYSNGGDAIVLPSGDEGLAGKSLALEEFSRSHYLLWRYLLRQQIAPADVRVRNITAAGLLDSFGAGSGVAAWYPQVGQLLHDRQGTLLFDSRAIPNEIADVLVVRREALQASPQFARVLLFSWFGAMDRMQGNRRESAFDTLARLSGMDRMAYEEALRYLALPENPGRALSALRDRRQLQKTLRHVRYFAEQNKLAGADSGAWVSLPGSIPARLHYNTKPLQEYLTPVE